MQQIPKGTTYIWTPGFLRPMVPLIIGWRRGCYKRVNGVWYSFNRYGEWCVSGNDVEWFDEEKKLGYFVTRRKFNSPGFIPVKEEA